MTNEVNERAAKIMSEFQDEKNIDKILESLGSLGEDAQKQAGESLEALKRPVNEMMTQNDNKLPTQLHELREIVSELEPNYLKESGFQKMMNKMFGRNPIQQYAKKYQTVEVQVEQIIEALLKGKDKLQEDNVMLAELRVVARQRIAGLDEQISIGKQLNDMLEQEMKNEENQEHFTALQKGQQKVVTRIKNMTQAVMVLQQSIASVDIIIENNDKLEEAIFNAITMTKNIITVTASIQLALGNQRKVINAVKNVNEATESMLLSNAQMLKENTQETLKTLEEPAIAIDTFKKAYEDVYAAIQMTEQSNERIIASGKKFITEVDELNKQMKTKLLGS
ncbi:toxic anion resistance protein [Alkalihalobacillus sp. LMS39]|uniref:toxic anion resistance protein n=1 Tax=Alkalihalobacillus sp. LMS39 TaxID=2924032 RepID=UPI001FB1CD22|nr:toxic anion resistance protein [Alkalihalobacillus sp. LMS39]UOE92270.1 toxic anion resistance protein [Alkalihalobacillus sp. LMS39]